MQMSIQGFFINKTENLRQQGQWSVSHSSNSRAGQTTQRQAGKITTETVSKMVMTW